MKKNLLVVSLGFLGCLVSLNSNAANVTNTGGFKTIAAVNIVYIGTSDIPYISAVIEGAPTCGGASKSYWLSKLDEPGGKAKFSLLLTAFSSGKKIYTEGSGCPVTVSTTAHDMDSVFLEGSW